MTETYDIMNPPTLDIEWKGRKIRLHDKFVTDRGRVCVIASLDFSGRITPFSVSGSKPNGTDRSYEWFEPDRLRLASGDRFSHWLENPIDWFEYRGRLVRKGAYFYDQNGHRWVVSLVEPCGTVTARREGPSRVEPTREFSVRSSLLSSLGYSYPIRS